MTRSAPERKMATPIRAEDNAIHWLEMIGSRKDISDYEIKSLEWL